MLSAEETELLTRTNPDTPMGTLFRRYWIPALLSAELPAPDCPPVKVKLLGEDLVAFRDSEGRIGLLDEFCSHRRASLFYARNEECGLRCVYHGWKYDVDGKVLDTPAEPAEGTLKRKLVHKAYPCREAAGIIFVYMGPTEKMPLFPTFEWMSLPPGHVVVTKWFQDCNYLQILEGECDSAHVPFLHRGTGGFGTGHSLFVPLAYEVTETPFGIRSFVARKVPPDAKVVQNSHFAMPSLGINAVGKMIDGKLDGALVAYHIPASDFHTWKYYLRYRRSQPLFEDEQEFDRWQIGPDFRPKAPKQGEYFVVDRKMQKTTNATGLEGFIAQDSAMVETMGAICDRAKEHLGVSDTYMIAVRRFLLKAVKALQEGCDPPGINIKDSSEVRCTFDRVPLQRLE